MLHYFFFQAKDQLKENSLKDYKGLISTEVLSLGWNIVMMKVKIKPFFCRNISMITFA